MKRKVLALFLTASMVISLAACGAKEEGTEAVQETEVAEETSEKITFMCWYDESNMTSIIDTLNAELGGKYVVEYTYVALDDFNNVLSTQLAAGEGPDIIADGTNFPARIKTGSVVDISDQAFVKEFNEAGFSLTNADGKIYGIPSYGWFSGIG